MYAQINFGRSFNVEGHGKLEMNERTFRQMSMMIESYLERFASAVTFDEALQTRWSIEAHDGIGSWDDFEERSRHLSLVIEGSTRQDNYVSDCIKDLVLDLQSVRQDHYQDAIVVIIAGSYTNHDGVYYAN